MSASLGMWEEIRAKEEECIEGEIPSVRTEPTATEQFADEQILGLIRGVFFPGLSPAARQVVFSGISEDAGSAEISVRVGEALANQTTGRICVVETRPGTRNVEHEFGGPRADGGHTPEAAGAVRASSLQLKRNLWLVPAGLWRPTQTASTIPWVRRRLGELRGEFDYAVIHAPPVPACAETGMLAQLADGLVLVLEAHRTRRVLARIAHEKLQAANVRILGAVLSGRTFPIPERLYRRL